MDRNDINQHVTNQREPTQESTQITLDDFVEYNSSEDAIALLRLMSREYKSNIASRIYSAIDVAKAVDYTRLIKKWRYAGFHGKCLILSHTAKARNAIKISIVFRDTISVQHRGVFVKVQYRESKGFREILSVQETMSRAKIGRILFESDSVARARVDKSLTNSITCLLNRAKKEVRKLWGF